MIGPYTPSSRVEGVSFLATVLVFFVTGWWWLLVLWLAFALALYVRAWQREKRDTRRPGS